MGPDGTQRTDEVWGLKVSEVRYRRNLEEITVAGENST